MGVSTFCNKNIYYIPKILLILSYFLYYSHADIEEVEEQPILSEDEILKLRTIVLILILIYPWSILKMAYQKVVLIGLNLEVILVPIHACNS